MTGKTEKKFKKFSIFKTFQKCNVFGSQNVLKNSENKFHLL